MPLRKEHLAPPHPKLPKSPGQREQPEHPEAGAWQKWLSPKAWANAAAAERDRTLQTAPRSGAHAEKTGEAPEPFEAMPESLLSPGLHADARDTKEPPHNEDAMPPKELSHAQDAKTKERSHAKRAQTPTDAENGQAQAPPHPRLPKSP